MARKTTKRRARKSTARKTAGSRSSASSALSKAIQEHTKAISSNIRTTQKDLSNCAKQARKELAQAIKAENTAENPGKIVLQVIKIVNDEGQPGIDPDDPVLCCRWRIQGHALCRGHRR